MGRGGKRGTYSGKGVKGQKSRAGHRIRPAERDFIQRLPKRRGFANKPDTRTAHTIVNVDELQKLQKLNHNAPIKILGKGEVKNADAVDFSKFTRIIASKSARAKLEKAGVKLIA